MATIIFPGVGTSLGKFTVDGVVIATPLLPGEKRMYSPFPYSTLEMWRRTALSATSTLFELPTQCRTTLLFAHEVDMQTVFLELTRVDPKFLAGKYDFKKKAVLADSEMSTARESKALAFKELAQQRVPEQYVELIQQRVESSAFNHRVTGMCAAVYMTAILLEEAEAIA
jgi:hypothetical protein